MAHLKLYLLGSPQVEVDEKPVEISRRKVLALLAYLAGSGEASRRDTLAALLWPETTSRRSRAALARHLSELKQRLGEKPLIIERETVNLRRDADFWFDIDQFQRNLAFCSDETVIDESPPMFYRPERGRRPLP